MPYRDYEAQKVYQREWRARRRAAFMADKICARCPSRDRLELDHLDPAKKVTHNVWSWSQARRDAEIAKCQILCHDCHKKKTLAMRRKVSHGSGWMYQHYKCRCDRCRAWKSASDRKYRKNQPHLEQK